MAHLVSGFCHARPGVKPLAVGMRHILPVFSSLPFPLNSTSMTFSFKLDGHLVSVNVRPESHSYISTLCARRLGLPIVAGAFNGAVSVKI